MEQQPEGFAGTFALDLNGALYRIEAQIGVQNHDAERFLKLRSRQSQPIIKAFLVVV